MKLTWPAILTDVMKTAVAMVLCLQVCTACFIDTRTLTTEELYETDKKVQVKVSGLSAETGLFLRMKTDRTSTLAGPSEVHTADLAGRFIFTEEIDFHDSTMGLVLFLDLDKDQKLGSNDKGYINSAITVPSGNVDYSSEPGADTEKVVLQVELTEASFSNLVRVDVPTPGGASQLKANRNYICVFSPNNMTSWSSADIANFFTYPEVPRPLSDWAMIATFQTDGSSVPTNKVSAYMVANVSYTGVCSTDDDNDGKYDYNNSSLSEISIAAFTPVNDGDEFTIP